MAGGGKGGHAQTESRSTPWVAQQPYLTQGFGSAQNLYGIGKPGNPGSYGPQYYPGQTYSPATDAQTQGLQQVANLGLSGTDVGNAASNAVTGVLGGSPEMTQSILAQVLPGIEGQF